MKLYLVRHAIAEDTGNADDHERALTDTGRVRMIRAVEGMRKMKIRPVLILTSPLRRARETAEILGAGLAGVKIELMAELAPGVNPAQMAIALRAYTRQKSLALVGHQPGLGHLASFLLTGSDLRFEMDFKKGGVACLEAEFSDDPTRCVLNWFATPKLLRSL